MKQPTALVQLSLALALAATALSCHAQGNVIDAKTRAALEAAFTRADTNADNKLSPDEAERLPAIAAKFKELDKDKDGFLSLAEFAVGYTAAS